ncbi:MAG TPA: hypothetical protein PLV62_05520, partial [Spirochaetota bacterium]|nr:hypothetical protein [Spirochaetota bacterium]
KAKVGPTSDKYVNSFVSYITTVAWGCSRKANRQPMAPAPTIPTVIVLSKVFMTFILYTISYIKGKTGVTGQ